MEHSNLFSCLLIITVLLVLIVKGQLRPDFYDSRFPPRGYQHNPSIPQGFWRNVERYRPEEIRSVPHSFTRRSPDGFYSPEDRLKGRRVVCLFNSVNFYKAGFLPSMIQPHLCTHINYEFATLDPTTYEMSYSDKHLDIDRNFYREIVDLKIWNPSLKILLSVGGWKDSTKKYSDLVASPEKTENFVTKAVSFLRNRTFDGLDVAWEYPNCWQGALGISPSDKPNFVSFLKRLRTELDTEGMLLSISVGAIKREIMAAYDVPAIAKIVDYINVMTYDMHGPWEKQTGHHSQFDKKPTDSDPTLNSKGAMDLWASLGVPKLQLNMGIATYAKTFTLADPNNNGYGAPTIGPGRPGSISNQAGFLYYNELCQYLNMGNWTEGEDKEYGFYAYSGDQWACYDNPLMAVKKVKYLALNGYGGVLIKDVSGDDYNGTCLSMPFPLLKLIMLEFESKMRKIH